jgi:type IV secretion system protein VirB10
VPIGKPPFPLEKPTQGEKDKAHDKPTSPLVQEASWAQLAHPVYALYRTQTIHGMLTHNVDSDIPGQIHILVTRPVFDELGQGVTIIPQLSKLLAVQAGKTTYGTRRLDVSIEEIQFPDKTLVRLAKAKLADQSGAVGGAGTVDNHLGRVILGAGLSALLSVGARSAGGSSNSFQPSVEQEVSRDIAGSINQSGQQIVRQQLSIGPTITLAAGDPVTIQLQENISFQKPPVIVTQ